MCTLKQFNLMKLTFKSSKLEFEKTKATTTKMKKKCGDEIVMRKRVFGEHFHTHLLRRLQLNTNHTCNK